MVAKVRTVAFQGVEVTEVETQVTIGMLTYEQGVAPFRDTKRLSENDKAALMGGTLQKVYKW
jgi:hypothetical protein